MRVLIFLQIYSFTLLFAQVSYNQEFWVSSYTIDYPDCPKVSYLADGGFIVCWTVDRQDGNSEDIYAQLFNKDGSRRDTLFRVNTSTADNQRWPKISLLSDGGFIICWTSYGTLGYYSRIHFQLFNQDGSKRGSESSANLQGTSTEGPGLSAVSQLTDGGFVVCWQKWVWPQSYHDVYAQLFNQDGSRRNNEFQLNTITTGSNPQSRLFTRQWICCLLGQL